MLTQNFSVIIQMVKQKLDTNTINLLSAEEIGNINLMLRGYIGLLQCRFKTHDDSERPSAPYATCLIEILEQLSSIQEQKLNHAKQSLLRSFITKMDDILSKIDSIPQLNLSKNSAFKKLKQTKEILYKQLIKCINDPNQGCMELIRTAYKLSNQMELYIAQIKIASKTKNISVYEEQFSLVTTTYLKKMTQAYLQEQDNQHSISFVAMTQFGDHLINC